VCGDVHGRFLVDPNPIWIMGYWIVAHIGPVMCIEVQSGTVFLEALKVLM